MVLKLSITILFYMDRFMGILFSALDKNSQFSLSDQLCEKISYQISAGILKPNQRLPSCRKIAQQLEISRNTVVSAYQTLIYDGIVESRERSGYFVNSEARAHCATKKPLHKSIKNNKNLFDFMPFNKSFTKYKTIVRQKNWANYAYPFVCNQIDAKRFPLANWRKCSADILSQSKSVHVISDYSYDDCDELITEIQTRILPSRGIAASKDEILLTSGTQQAIYLTSMIFGNSQRSIAIEDPCYPDAKNIFDVFFDKINPVKLDDEGIICSPELAQSDLVYVTPNHQYPTSIRMSKQRRTELLTMARENKIVIIEDDYDAKTDFDPQIMTALKADDSENNIIYCGSLSKDLNPGLRIGYMVASADFILEAKMRRGLMIRHLPPLLQLTTAHFIKMGHQDAHLNMLQSIYKHRWNTAYLALKKYFPDSQIISGSGGTNFLIKTNLKLDFSILEEKALERGVVIDPLKLCYSDPKDSYGMFRLGVSAIGVRKITEGIKVLREVYEEVLEAANIARTQDN